MHITADSVSLDYHRSTDLSELLRPTIGTEQIPGIKERIQNHIIHIAHLNAQFSKRECPYKIKEMYQKSIQTKNGLTVRPSDNYDSILYPYGRHEDLLQTLRANNVAINVNGTATLRQRHYDLNFNNFSLKAQNINLDTDYTHIPPIDFHNRGQTLL